MGRLGHCVQSQREKMLASFLGPSLVIMNKFQLFVSWWLENRDCLPLFGAGKSACMTLMLNCRYDSAPM